MTGRAPSSEGASKPTSLKNAIVTSKWIYKIKHAVDGNIKKYKERFIRVLPKREKGL